MPRDIRFGQGHPVKVIPYQHPEQNGSFGLYIRPLSPNESIHVRIVQLGRPFAGIFSSSEKQVFDKNVSATRDGLANIPVRLQTGHYKITVRRDRGESSYELSL